MNYLQITENLWFPWVIMTYVMPGLSLAVHFAESQSPDLMGASASLPRSGAPGARQPVERYWPASAARSMGPAVLACAMASARERTRSLASNRLT